MSQLEREEREVRKGGAHRYILESQREDGQIAERKPELKAALKRQGRDGVIERWKDKDEGR